MRPQPQPIRRPTAPAQTPTRPLPTIDIRQAITNAKQAAQDQTGSFAGAETRDRWWGENSQLWLHALALGDGQFGRQWTLTVSEAEKDALQVKFSLKDNGYRNIYFSKLNELLTLVKEPIGPFMLTKFLTTSGQESWSFDEWSNEPAADQPF